MFIVVGSIARADDISSEFREAGRQIPTALQARGYQQFGSLDLSTLLNKIDSTEVSSTSVNSVGTRNSDGRITARWENHGRASSIVVSIKAWQRWPGDHGILALHEYLGVSGFDDHNYWLSTKLWFLSLSETHAVVSGADTSTIEQNLIQKISVGGGGVIGVGGGGEISTLHFRSERLVENLQKMRNARDSREFEMYRQQIPSLLESRLSVSFGKYISQPKVKRSVSAAKPPLCMTDEQMCPKFKEVDASCTCAGRPGVYGAVIWPVD